MTTLLALEAFRAVVLSSASDVPSVHLAKSTEAKGFLLVSETGAYLKSARGSLRVFSTADAALKYVSDQICKGYAGHVSVRVTLKFEGV